MKKCIFILKPFSLGWIHIYNYGASLYLGSISYFNNFRLKPTTLNNINTRYRVQKS